MGTAFSIIFGIVAIAIVIFIVLLVVFAIQGDTGS